MKSKRIGIISGSFDPIHSGHINFALQALKEAKLDNVYFIVERRPKYSEVSEHYAHRLAMVKQAILPHPKFKIEELDDLSLNCFSSLTKLKYKFKHQQLIFLFGSDKAKYLPTWPKIERLLKHELVIGLRKSEKINKTLKQLNQPKVTIVDCHDGDITSSAIQRTAYNHIKLKGLLSSVEHYINQNWLYVRFIGDSDLS